MRILNKIFFDGFYSLVNPIGTFLTRANIHPHVITAAGFLLSVFSAALFWRGYFFWGGVILIVSGACDVLDGKLARSTNRTSRFGAVLDSSVDRYTEIFVFMAGSLMTSYIRARAEGMGIECKIGLMQRPERVTFIAAGAILGSLIDLIFKTQQPLIKLAIVAIAVFSNYTVIQRVIFVRDQIIKEIEKE